MTKRPAKHSPRTLDLAALAAARGGDGSTTTTTTTTTDAGTGMSTGKRTYHPFP